MATHLPQNQFISNLAVTPEPPTAGSAVASSDLQPQATAAPFAEPSMTNGGDQETSASAPPKNPDAGVLDMTDCINEIFFYARKLMKQPPRFILNERQFMAEVEEVPLFLREDGYLQRREA